MNKGKPGTPGDDPTVPAKTPDGDFELARPTREPATAGVHEGDYELEHPSSTPTPPGPPAAPAGQPGPPTAPGPAAAARAPAPVPGDSVGRDDVDGTAGTGQAARPLHDPDPYSTPPYGEPGPWAPAPPVQHPPGTPAHGVPGAGAAPAGDPYAAGTPAHGVPGPVAGSAGDAGPGPVFPGPAVQAPASADPWGRYDPWAAAAGAPLQRAEPVLMDGKQRRGRARRAVIGGALLLALVSGGVGGVVGGYLERNGGIGTVELPQAGREDVRRAPDSVAGIAEQALPSVVTLHVSGAGAAGTGTGFVLDGRGHILTNDHVVEPAGENGEITVTFHSGDTAEATVVGRDAGYDLAVVKVKGVSGLAPLPLGNSDNVRVGDPVVAIGAPFDLAGTVTAGIISARERPITAGGENGDGTDVSYVDALQTDAPINPGNSGGPLLDAQGRVIGINSAIRSAGSGGADPDGGQAGSIGLGFAIPVNQGKRVAEELINTGKAAHPVIGITLDMEYGGDGARVATEGQDGGPPVSTGGPGATAGIKAGDVITEVDGRRVHSGEELIVKTRAHRPGDRLELTLERGGEERKVSLVLGSSDG
ncbi:trypsin-like peptidase domain-containing protein [Streptomyces sp. CHD11]|uniref:trypsin-like peptidase domain-containing protein n=1 Tax=Streptomyces sp. CHD11 TaxID=2741325 RepID=UPI001BFCBE71|nr:trypsin-like peptidase domain-containing protein [Streptomyces sp. CHD11]MBT3151447.1 trypsin-like peptidase domain-containing protein [Streptomyces sp. CHD11]